MNIAITGTRVPLWRRAISLLVLLLNVVAAVLLLPVVAITWLIAGPKREGDR